MNVLYVEDDENIANPTLTLLERFFHKRKRQSIAKRYAELNLEVELVRDLLDVLLVVRDLLVADKWGQH